MGAYKGTLTQVTVPYEEIYGDSGSGQVVEEDLTYQSSTAVKSFFVAWADRWKFVAQTIARVESTNYGTVYAPLQYPDAPWLYLQEVNMKGYGNFSQGPTQIAYEKALVTCTFRSLQYQFDSANDPNGYNPIPYASIQCEFGAQQIELPAGAFKFQAGGAVVNKPQSRIIPTVNLSVQQHFCPYIPLAAIYAACGTVNSQAFLGAAAGYSLYLGCSSQSDLSVTSDLQGWSLAQSITHKFAYRAVPWNQVMKPDGSGFDYIVDASSNYIYPSYDHNELFFYGGSTPSF